MYIGISKSDNTPDPIYIKWMGYNINAGSLKAATHMDEAVAEHFSFDQHAKASRLKSHFVSTHDYSGKQFA